MLLQRFVITPRWLVLCHILLATNTLFCNCSSFTTYSCDTFRPTGAQAAQPFDTNPFTASTSSDGFYTPNIPIQITINAANPTTTYQGIFLQSTVEGSTRPIGSFSQENEYIILDCGGDTNATIINDDNFNRNVPVTFTWTPPAYNVGHIIIIIDIEVRKGVYWWFAIWLTPITTPNCNTNPCQNGGTCALEPDNTLYCVCLPPFTGPLCTDCITTPCDSEPSPCPSTSFCLPDSCNDYTCTIVTASECAVCGDSPCLNGGTCIHDTSHPLSFVCQCESNFQAKFCNHAVLLTIINFPETYQLPSDVKAIVDNGEVDCIVFNVLVSDVTVEIINIDGYLYTYGEGIPKQRPQKPNLRLDIPVGSSFWFCLKLISIQPVFVLELTPSIVG